jgi:hypothetical protein
MIIGIIIWGPAPQGQMHVAIKGFFVGRVRFELTISLLKRQGFYHYTNDPKCVANKGV